MRLWSISPEYLDSRGLVTLWREALLAQKVLSGKTRGYCYHPQLERFRSHPFSLQAICYYLYVVYKEGQKRGYDFDKKKIMITNVKTQRIKVSDGQVDFEFRHLLLKLKNRCNGYYRVFLGISRPKLHPLFIKTSGRIEKWERGR